MAVGAALGAALGAAGGDAMSGMASAFQYQASKHERNRAWQRMQQWELISPSLRMEGLRRAGLNPILAATQGFVRGGSSVPEGRPGGMPSFRGDYVGRALSSARQAALLDEQVKTARAQRETAEWEARAARFLPERAYHQAGAEGERWSSLSEQVALLRAQAENTSAQTARTNVDRRLMEAELPSAQALQELYEKYPWLRQAREVGKSLSGAIPTPVIRYQRFENARKRGRR